jgi:diguanylate cyclase (GGDEF)-like protein
MDEPAVSFNSAAFDALTGLPNRALFEDRLSQVLALSSRSGRRFAIHRCDLDGCGGSDAVLKIIAERFVAVLRESDTVARIGGDEFAVLQPELEDEEDARDLSDRLLRAVYAPVTTGSGNCQTGVTIGIALFPLDGETGSSLFAAAEQALSRAKAQARGSVVFA